MKILGLDIGYETGVCLITLAEGRIADVNVGSVTIPPERRTEFFVYDLAKEVEELIGDIRPCLVCMEDYAYGGSGFFNVRQAEIQAQIKRYCVSEEIPLFSAHLQNMRKVITGNGNIQKAGVKKHVRSFMDEEGFLYRYDKVKDYHIYDATLPAMYGMFFLTKQLSDGDNKVVSESIIGSLPVGKSIGENNENSLC